MYNNVGVYKLYRYFGYTTIKRVCEINLTIIIQGLVFYIKMNQNEPIKIFLEMLSFPSCKIF